MNECVACGQMAIGYDKCLGLLCEYHAMLDGLHMVCIVCRGEHDEDKPATTLVKAWVAAEDGHYIGHYCDNCIKRPMSFESMSFEED